MSNPDSNQFSNTTDPDLETSMATEIDTELGDDVQRTGANKKKKNTKALALIGIIVLALVGYTAWQVASSYMTPKPTNARSGLKAPVKPVDAGLAKSSAQIETSPNGSLAVVTGTTQSSPDVAVAVAPGDGVSVSIGGGTQPVVAAPDMQKPAIAPLAVSNGSGAGTSPLAQAKTVAPVAVTPVAVQTSLPTDSAKYAKAEDVEKLTGRVVALEGEMSGLKLLDGRIRKMEERPASGVAIKKIYVKQPAPKYEKEAQPQKESMKTDARPGFWMEESRPQGRVDGDVMGKARAQVASLFESSPAEAPRAAMETASTKAYQLVAIVQGRAWVKLSDGSMLTVQDGDLLPNGLKIVKINAGKDEVLTSAGTLR